MGVDDQVLFENTSTQAEFLLYILEQAAGSNGFYVNLSKTELMCFKQDEATSTLNGTPLKLVDRFTYLGSNIASTEIDVN